MSKLPPGLRIRILERDGYRCIYCGSTPRQAYLHVDHVVPASHGGSNDPTNLVTACGDCNMGKSDRQLALPEGFTPGALEPKPYGHRRRWSRTRSGLPKRELIWPVGIGMHRGWPLPDGAWDDECPEPHTDGFLPWAIWQKTPTWWIGFYSCDRGHAWTCGYGSVAGWTEVHNYRISPIHRMPSDEYLRERVGEPSQIKAIVLAYPFSDTYYDEHRPWTRS